MRLPQLSPEEMVGSGKFCVLIVISSDYLTLSFSVQRVLGPIKHFTFKGWLFLFGNSLEILLIFSWITDIKVLGNARYRYCLKNISQCIILSSSFSSSIPKMILWILQYLCLQVQWSHGTSAQCHMLCRLHHQCSKPYIYGV